MYLEGLGFSLLGSFEDHNGFDGAIIGHENHSYHLEFTNHSGVHVGKAPTPDYFLRSEKRRVGKDCSSSSAP